MSYKVQLTQKAVADMASILKYLTLTTKNEEYAQKLLASFQDNLQHLYSSPYLFQLCKHQGLAERGYRSFLFSKRYIAIYSLREDKQTVFILRIFQAARRYERFF